MKRFEQFLCSPVMEMIGIILLIMLVSYAAMGQVMCPYCAAEGEKSVVYEGQITSTLMGWIPYYDENGQYHNDDPNITTYEYSCSRGHYWKEDYQHGELIERIPIIKAEYISDNYFIVNSTAQMAIQKSCDEKAPYISIIDDFTTESGPSELEKLRKRNEVLESLVEYFSKLFLLDRGEK